MSDGQAKGILGDKLKLSGFLSREEGRYKVKALADAVLQAFAEGDLSILQTSEPMYTKGGKVRPARAKEAEAFRDMYIMNEEQFKTWLDGHPELRAGTRNTTVEGSPYLTVRSLEKITSEDEIQRLVEQQRQVQIQSIEQNKAREQAKVHARLAAEEAHKLFDAGQVELAVGHLNGAKNQLLNSGVRKGVKEYDPLDQLIQEFTA